MEVGEPVLYSSKPAEVPFAEQSSTSAHYNRVKPTTLTMVLEAVKSLNEKKGSSVFAIQRYILHNYPDVDPIRLKYFLKMALAKGLDKGHLIRPLNSNVQGATGRFKLVPKKSKQGKGKEVEFSDGETAPKPAKKAEAVKKPRSKTPAAGKPKSKTPAGKPKSKTPAGKPRSETDPAEGQKRPKIAGAKTEHGNNSSKAPAKSKEEASRGKAAKATKKESAPKASQAKPASGPKETTSKTKMEAKGPAKPKADGAKQPPPAEKAKGATGAAKEAKTNTAADSAKAKAGSGTKKTKSAAPQRKKPEAKKGVAKGKGKKEVASVSDVSSEDL